MGLFNPATASTSTALAYSTKSTNYTLLTSDNVVAFNCASGSLVATLPTAAGNTGLVFQVDRLNDATSNTLTINTTGAQTMSGKASGGIILAANGDYAKFLSDGTNWQILNKQETSLVTVNGNGTVTGAAGDYLAGFGANTSLTPGIFRLTGYMGINQASSTNLAVTNATGFFAADGTGTSTPPTALTGIVSGNSDYSNLGSGYVWYFGGANGSANNSRNTVTPISFIYKVATTHSVYFVPRMDFGAAGSATVHLTLTAERIW